MAVIRSSPGILFDIVRPAIDAIGNRMLNQFDELQALPMEQPLEQRCQRLRGHGAYQK